MPVSVWCEFVCAKCAKTGHTGRHVIGGRIPLIAMRDQAERNGWHFTRDDAYCSRKCFDAVQET